MAAFTEKAIIESFIKLLNEKPLDKITVKDVIDECGVNRSTFYYYFEDIYDLLSHILETETNRIAENHLSYDSWTDGVFEAMSFAIQNRKAIFHIYKSLNREKLEHYLNDIFDSVMIEAVRIIAKDYKVTEEDIHLVADVYKFTLTGLVFKWLEDGMTSEPKEVISKLSYMLDGNIMTMLEKAEKYKA